MSDFRMRDFRVTLVPAIAVASGLAGLSLMFWLIVFGVNAERWNEQAGITEGSV
jgi:hypothetical protein